MKRATPRIVDRVIQAHRAAYYDCVRMHWTLDTFIKARRSASAHADGYKLTHFDSGRIVGISQTLFDLVNCGEHMEWRLGFEDIRTAVKTWTYGNLPDGTRNLPTHGAHFWIGTNIPFNGWTALDPRSVSAVSL